MTGAAGDRWAGVAWSVVLHALVAAVLVWGWWQWRPPVRLGERLAIEASVVQLAPATVAPTPAPQPQTTPVDDSAVRDAQRDALRADAERQTRERAEAQARAEAEAAREARAAQQKQAEQQARAQQEAKALAAKRAAALADAQRQKREQELRQQLANEERLNAARASGEMDRYKAMIQARIINNWIRPATARAGLLCEVRVTQVPGGTVTAVQIGRCNGDASVRASIESAVIRSSPLPEPPTADLFERNLLFNFQPDE